MQPLLFARDFVNDRIANRTCRRRAAKCTRLSLINQKFTKKGRRLTPHIGTTARGMARALGPQLRVFGGNFSP